ncbi:MAG: recombinase family protein, partial [Alphaproteobacteria bacterium]|nr:recombinase family protein [Alphaproteobacteria bacterium]
RTALLDLLSDCETGRVRTVLVYKMDRLARELTISLWLESKFKQHDVQVLSVVDPELGDDPLEKAFRRIAYVFAELERDVITARLKDGRINKAKNGERASGPVPFGYQKQDDNLIVHPDEAIWVEKIFRWVSRGFSYSKVVKELNKRGVRTKRGKPFHVEAVKYIIRNPLYFGEANFGLIKCQGTHQAIISKRRFYSVNRECHSK